MSTRHSPASFPDPGLRNILTHLRRQLVDGDFKPGERLPTMRELAARYQVAGTTIQRCLQELTAAGFLSTHGRNGTRVVDYPPHRHRYGLVLPELPELNGMYRKRHWQAMAVAARALSTGPACHVEIFHGINGHAQLTEHQRLLTAIAEQRIAGLIVVDENRIRDWLVPATLSVPVVGVALVPGHPAIGNLRLQLTSFLTTALQEMARRKYQRPAVLMDGSALYAVPTVRSVLTRLGLTWMPQHVLCLPTANPGWAEHLIVSLFSAPASMQPDALIVADEAVIPAVQKALRVHHRLPLPQIHMANLPLPSLANQSANLSALRLGWDHRVYLRSALAAIDAWHRDRRPIGDTDLPLEPISA